MGLSGKSTTVHPHLIAFVNTKHGLITQEHNVWASKF